LAIVWPRRAASQGDGKATVVAKAKRRKWWMFRRTGMDEGTEISKRKGGDSGLNEPFRLMFHQIKGFEKKAFDRRTRLKNRFSGLIISTSEDFHFSSMGRECRRFRPTSKVFRSAPMFYAIVML
jgi:hypothetical protein